MKPVAVSLDELNLPEPCRVIKYALTPYAIQFTNCEVLYDFRCGVADHPGIADARRARADLDAALRRWDGGYDDLAQGYKVDSQRLANFSPERRATFVRW
jgi:hypothetical protein